MLFLATLQWLLTISADESHTVRLWDWKAKELLAETQGMKGIAPQMFSAVWNRGTKETMRPCPLLHLHVSSL